MNERAKDTIEIMTLDGGGDPIFLAWGEHEPVAFVRAIPGMEDDAEEYTDGVRFERWENVGPKNGCALAFTSTARPRRALL